MKKRNLCPNKLILFKDKPFIKIMIGMRRSGKSSILLLFNEYLIKNGVKEKNIVYINFESREKV